MQTIVDDPTILQPKPRVRPSRKKALQKKADLVESESDVDDPSITEPKPKERPSGIKAGKQKEVVPESEEETDFFEWDDTE